jgi:hypothetical protein
MEQNDPLRTSHSMGRGAPVRVLAQVPGKIVQKKKEIRLIAHIGDDKPCQVSADTLMLCEQRMAEQTRTAFAGPKTGDVAVSSPAIR